MNRRDFIKVSALGLSGISLIGSYPAWSSVKSTDLRLVASESGHKFVPEQSEPTQVMSYNRSIPGPILRIPQGVESSIVFENKLKESSTIHWHDSDTQSPYMYHCHILELEYGNMMGQFEVIG